MEVVVINGKEWQELNQRLQRMEQLLQSLIVTTKEKLIPAEEGYITMKSAVTKYKQSRQTISKKANLHKVNWLPAGKQKLLKESELIAALAIPSPFVFKKKKKK